MAMMAIAPMSSTIASVRRKSLSDGATACTEQADDADGDGDVGRHRDRPPG